MAKRDVNATNYIRAAHDLQPNLATIRKFLNELRRDWFHLHAIDPNIDKGKVYSYVADGVEDAVDWIVKQQAREYNIYYALNTPSNKQAKKARKEELRHLNGVYVDIDLPDDVDRHSAKAEAEIQAMTRRCRSSNLVAGQPVVVMTGNGVQALWLFDEPLKATEENQSHIETTNKRLAKHLGAQAGTHNAERILRMPGTVNHPNAKKRSKGYQPVMSELVCLSDRDFGLSDFDKLPKMDPVAIRETPRMVDYRRFEYSDDWTPYRWRDVMQHMPQIPNEIAKKYKGQDEDGDGSRSACVWILVKLLLAFLVLVTDEQAETWQDDNDIKRNVMDLCFEGAEHDDVLDAIMGHIHEHEYGAAKLGADVSRALNAAADDGLGPSVRLEASARQAQELAAIAAMPEDVVTLGDASRAFIAWVSNSVPKDHLPVAAIGALGPASRQPSTLSNVRHVLAKSGITARWDAMRDEVRFTVDPDAGLGGATPQRPAFNWARATSKAGMHDRSACEVALLLDALAQLGMAARGELEGFLKDIAREQQFHPLEDYCTAVRWDGVDRIAELANCLETEHPLRRRYLEMFLYQCVGAVVSLRTYVRHGRGVQLSATTVLIGPQGIGKSTFWEKLTPPGMLSEGRSLQMGSSREVDNVSACLSGLVCELGEIGGSLRRSEADALKDFQSTAVDKFRVAYGRRAFAKPRMTVFVGTANKDFKLTDPTGSRRYATMQVSWIDWDALNTLCDADSLQQLWAQAWHAVMVDGEAWTLTPDEADVRDRENDNVRAETSEEGALAEYLSGVTKMYQSEWLTMTQICKLLDIKYAPARAGQLHTALAACGIEYRAKVTEGKRQHRKVFRMPVTAERWEELRTLRR